MENPSSRPPLVWDFESTPSITQQAGLNPKLLLQASLTHLPSSLEFGPLDSQESRSQKETKQKELVP